MGTQYYAPQQTAPPMARIRPAKWLPQAGVRNVITLETVPGRLVPSAATGIDEVVFEVEGGRPWYVPQVTANNIYATGVRAGQQIEVTVTGRKKTDLLIVPVQPRLSAASVVRATPAAGTDTTSRDTQSRNGFHPTPPLPPPPQPLPAAPPARTMSPTSLRWMAAYHDATDILVEEKAYAQSQGLALEIRCEDVRCLAAAMMIDNSRNGGAR